MERLVTVLLLLSPSVLGATRDVTRRNSPESPPPTDATFIRTALSAVNDIRSKHDASNLSWNTNLASISLQKANTCIVDHSGSYGSTIYWFWYVPVDTRPNFPAQLQSGFDFWVRPEEVDAYKAGNLPDAYHLTQTIWKSTKEIGCAFSTERCSQNEKQEWFLFCEFNPPGNIRGYYPGNVTL